MATVIRLKQRDPFSALGEGLGAGFSQGVSTELAAQASRSAQFALFKDKDTFLQKKEEDKWNDIFGAVDTLSASNPAISQPVFEQVSNELSGMTPEEFIAQTPEAGQIPGPEGVQVEQLKGQDGEEAPRVAIPRAGASQEDIKNAQQILRKHGKTLRFDKSLQVWTAADTKEAGQMNLTELQAENTKLTMKSKEKELQYRADQAEREGQQHEYRDSMISTISDSLINDPRYAALFPLDEKLRNDPVAREALAAHIADNFPSFAKTIASIDRESNLFVRSDASLDKINADDYKTKATKGYEPYNLWLQKQRLLVEGKKVEGKDGVSVWQKNEVYKNKQFLTRHDFKGPKFDKGSKLGAALDRWRTHEDNGWIIKKMNKNFFNADQLPQNFTADQAITQQINLMAQRSVFGVLEEMKKTQEGLSDVIDVDEAINVISQAYMQEMFKLGDTYGDDRAAALQDLKKFDKEGGVLTKAIRTLKGNQNYVLQKNRGKTGPGSNKGLRSATDSFKKLQGLIQATPKNKQRYIDNIKKYYSGDPESLRQFEALIPTLEVPQNQPGLSIPSAPGIAGLLQPNR